MRDNGNPGGTTRPQPRALRHERLEADLAVAGGGLAGVCCAITAAREGLNVLLVQDRPVLGGNASSEIRLWVLGATSHMGNNNRWAREGGVIDELLVENMWRNPEGNPIILDSIVLEFVQREERIHLLLNTAIDEVEMAADGAIATASAYCSQNQIRYKVVAPLFVDATGDGILGFLSGAVFRIGAEARSEFGEALAPEIEQHALLGHSLYFYSRDTGRPVKYVPPAFALQDITKIPRFRELRVSDSGCRLWWLEYGGARDTVYETEEIKWELWKVAYGVWDYIKNSGEFPDAETLTLEWMGMIPGKRESRRFEGDYMLTQQDVVEQRRHKDAVGFGGWAIDLHPSDGVYSVQPGCTQWHSKGVYQIPYRTMYSRNVPNLFLTGRLISASHIAFGSTRVMATCAHNGQAVGMAAMLCHRGSVRPRDLMRPAKIQELQQRLLRSGQHIPGVYADDPEDKARSASVVPTSILKLDKLSASGEFMPLDIPVALLLPIAAGPVPVVTVILVSSGETKVIGELWGASRKGNTTPDVKLGEVGLTLREGTQQMRLTYDVALEEPAHLFYVLRPAEGVEIALSEDQATGVLTLAQKMNKAVAKSLVQNPPSESGIDTFAFWLPERRPLARNLAAMIEPPLNMFTAPNVINGVSRPWCAVNAWIPAREDKRPALRLEWTVPQTIREIQISFDTDFDHPMESVLMGHSERVMPACVTEFEVWVGSKTRLAHVTENHQTRWNIKLKQPLETNEVSIVVLAHGPALPAIFEVRCY